MVSIKILIETILSLGVTLGVVSVDNLDYAHSYYNDTNKIVYPCYPLESDLGNISVCHTGTATAIIYVTKGK